MGDCHSFSYSANHHLFTRQLKQSLRQTLIHLPVQADTVHGSTGRPWYPPSPPQTQTHTYQPSAKEFYTLSCGLWLHHRLWCPHPRHQCPAPVKKAQTGPGAHQRSLDIKLILHQVNFCQNLRLPKWHRGIESFTSENTNRLVITRHSFSHFTCIN